MALSSLFAVLWRKAVGRREWQETVSVFPTLHFSSFSISFSQSLNLFAFYLIQLFSLFFSLPLLCSCNGFIFEAALCLVDILTWPVWPQQGSSISIVSCK